MGKVILQDHWEFGALGVYNYRLTGDLEEYFKFIEENHQYIKGDICEIGVYKGHSLLSTALFLKELGSDKKVFGFDSFAGSPAYHENDKLEKYDDLLDSNQISEEFYKKTQLNQKHRSVVIKKKLDASSISTSGDFSGTSLELVQRKIDYLQLDNIILIKGLFEETLKEDNLKTENFFAALIDCDLYLSYKQSLPFVWNRLNHGGYMFLDEYYSLKFPGARIATNEFFKDKECKPQMHKMKDRDFQRWFVSKI